MESQPRTGLRSQASRAAPWTATLTRDSTLSLTAALGGPAIVASLVTAQWGEAGAAIGVTAVAVAVQAAGRAANGRLRLLNRRQLLLAQLVVAILLAGVLIELVIPASFALYIPVVGIAEEMVKSGYVHAGCLCAIHGEARCRTESPDCKARAARRPLGALRRQ